MSHFIFAKLLKGEVGLLFTNEEKEKVVETMTNYTSVDYARAGTKATETVSFPKGPLPQFSHSMEPHLRTLGLPTVLTHGVIHLVSDHTICKEGEVLNPEQTKLLKHFEIKMSHFKIIPLAVWTSPGEFEMLSDYKPEELHKNGEGEELEEGDEHKEEELEEED